MSTVALSHGYPPLWNMGGEVSLHRTLSAINGDKIVLTDTKKSYTFEGIEVNKIDATNVLDVGTNPVPIAKQLKDLKAKVVIGQNELSLAGVKAAQLVDAVSIVNVHTPPKYGKGIMNAMFATDYAIYNTEVAAREWGEPNALVIHPPISLAPSEFDNKGDAYTLLSSLSNKGVATVLDLAKLYPNQRFIIVRSPAEATHGISNLEERAAELDNVELHPRVPPEKVETYFKQTKILLVPSRYETYGMSAIEAAGYGIPSVHVDTPHVREGIGDGAILVPPLNVEATKNGIDLIEKHYKAYSHNARKRAEWLEARQAIEMEKLADFIDAAKIPNEKEKLIRQKQVIMSSRRHK